MTKEERLELYKKALKDYKLLNSWWGRLFLKKENYFVEHGFCYYFTFKHNIKIDKNNLPELFKQSPFTFPHDFNHDLWYTAGKLAPRVKCLKQAIELCQSTN